MVCLIKPQFEAGREDVGKKGVVRDRKVHESVVLKTVELIKETGFRIKGLTYSPIRGPEGNIEYLVYIVKPVSGEEEESLVVTEEDIRRLVAESHENAK